MIRRLIGLSLTDLFVIAAVSLTFAATYFSQTGTRSAGPSPATHATIARELGVTPEQLETAARLVPPPPRGSRPSEAERNSTRYQLAGALNVPVQKLDAVMQRHRPPRD
ncbi:MAG: hypothetical protein JSR47_18395 [Proteobacteria bacterium]|nr:hypothetical protein [Pseudomonadota bacterium]